MEKRERLEEFYRRLAAGPASGAYDEAYALIIRVLNEVEDELSGVFMDPNPPKNPTDGRMYPPKPDRIYEVPGRPRVKRLRTKGHDIFIGDNGAIEIRARGGAIVFSKPGADGREAAGL